MKVKSVVAGFSLAFVLSSSVVAQDGGFALNPGRSPVQMNDLMEALMGALRNPTGEYRGELRGDFAAAIRAMSGSSTPVLVEVSTVNSFRQAGCGRLRTRVSQPMAEWVDAQKKAHVGREANFFLNICPDGYPPDDPKAIEPFKPRVD